jgi:hypothetical protein
LKFKSGKFLPDNYRLDCTKKTYLKYYSFVHEDGGKVRLIERFNEEMKNLTVKELC